MVRVSRMTSMIGRTSVMIIAVSLRLMFCAGVAVALTACGTRTPQQPVQAEQPVQAKVQNKAHDPLQVVDTRPIIAAFGDSLSAGFGVEPGKSYPDDLQR